MRWTDADVSQVVAIQEPASVVGLAEVFPQDRFPFPRDAVTQRWHEEIRAESIDCLVVLEEADLTGFAALRGDELLHFGIALDRWGSGIAQQAHDAVLGVLHDRGVTHVWLRVFTGNARGRAFYERLGWLPTGERSRSAFAPHPELLTYERQVIGDLPA